MPDVGDFIPELLCIGVDVVICGILYKVYHSTNTVIRDLTSAPQLSIDQDLKTALSKQPQSVVDDATQTVSHPYAVVRGSVAPMGRCVSSTYSAEQLQGVVQRVVFTEHKRNLSRATGFWWDSQRVIHQYTNDVPFCLINPKDAAFSPVKPFVEVVDWVDVTRVDMDTVYDKFEPNSATLGSHIWGWVVGDMQTGVQKTEMMLTQGSSLTGVGELVSGPMGVKLQPPSDGRAFFLVKNSLASLIKEYESSRTVIKVFLGIFGGVGVFITGMMAWKYYNNVKLERETRRNQDTLATVRRERGSRPARQVERERGGDGAEVADSLSCVVCLGAEREVILLPCGHVCVCADCADILITAGHTCPVCRANIDTVLPAYVS